MVQGRGWPLRAGNPVAGLDLRPCRPATRPVRGSDTLNDRRFLNNPLVTGAPHLRFYAGAPLETSEGLPLGTICVLDYKPRHLNDGQKDLLRLMARQIMKPFELWRQNAEEHTARKEAEALVTENATLAREGDHRVMNSLNLVSAALALQSRGSSNDE